MNTYTAIANLCRDPEPIELGGRPCMKLRLADNTFGKQSITLFFDAIVSGPDTDTAKRLEQGDQIAIAGTLQLTEYKGKKGKNKGQKVQSHQMPFAKILQVTKSDKFFSGAPDEADDSGVSNEGDQDPTAAADEGGTEAASEDTLAGVY